MNVRRVAAVSNAPILFVLLVSATAAAQQSDEDWLNECRRDGERSRHEVACQVRPVTMALAASGMHVDAGRNGGIAVSGSPSERDVRGSARIRAQAASRTRAAQIADAVRIEIADGRLSAAGMQTDDGESWAVNWALSVPQRADLDLRAVNGPVWVSAVNGRIRAVTRNGPLTLDDLAGDVHARATNGPLTVRLSGLRWDGAGLDAETRNGPVRLDVPADYSAELQIGTKNGPFSARAPITVTGQLYRGGHISTTLGSGGAPVRVVTTNGPATFSHR
jgi:hypothetical protein